jgi:hypothetical protein
MSKEAPSVVLPTNDNGVKLPYFHRTLSEQDKSLIGDTTPKPISSESSSGKSTPATSSSAASPWNGASTWEERNCTAWATNFITAMFSEESTFTAKYKDQSFDVAINEAKNISGNAQITHSRGKVRYLYELSFDLGITMNKSTSTNEYTATLKVSDVINDLLDDMELTVEWKKKPPSNTASAFNSAAIGSDIKKFIISKVKIFETEYRKL